MYLVVDIGNTNIVFALLDKSLVKNKWRISTDINRTSDEYFIWLSTIIKDSLNIKAVIIGSVVPEATEEIKKSCNNFLKKKVFVINEDIKINFPIKVENKKEVGTDRLVNSLAAWSFYKEATIIIDFGTATTFDVVDKSGAYVGGIICPGVNLSLQTLHSAAARLPRIAVTKPNQVIGKSTVQAMSSGIYFGYIGLIKHIIKLTALELKYKTKIILTGGLADLFTENLGINNIIKKNLTIEGLYLAYKQHKVNESDK
jgi:type III pantothenate kinase